MSNDDALAAMNAYDDQAYNDLLKEAETDSRVGDHDMLITKVVQDTWPSGDPRLKIAGTLITARNAKTDLTWSPPPPPEVVKAEKDSWEPGKLRAIANAVSMARQARQHYDKNITDFQEGQVIRVKTGKSRREKDGSGGFIRVVAILPVKGAESNGASGAPNPGF